MRERFEEVLRQLKEKSQVVLQLKTKVKEKWENAHLHARIGVVLLLAGILLASFPYFHNLYYQHQQQRQLEAQMAQMEEAQELKGNNLSQDFRETEDYQENPSIDAGGREKNQNDDQPGTFEPDTGILEIPSLELRQKIGYGVELTDLQDGPGFYPESQIPETGNVSIAGHRTTYGAPFRELNELEKGDRIKLYYGDKIYFYKVDDVFPTHSKDWSVIDPTSEPALTLTTCHPPGSDEKRLIVRAYLDGVED